MNGLKSFVRAMLLGATVTSLFLAGCNLPSRSYNVTGTQAFQAGNLNGAIKDFQKAISLNPQDPDAHYNLAACYQQLAKQTGDRRWQDQAENLYRQAIVFNNQHVAAHRGLATLLIESGREQFAFDLLNEWRDRNPQNEDPLVELARLYQEYGDNRRAVDLLTDALKINSQSVRALSALGHVREAQGQVQLALNNYARALQLDPQLTDIAGRVAALQNQYGVVPDNVDPGPSNVLYGDVAPYVRR